MAVARLLEAPCALRAGTSLGVNPLWLDDLGALAGGLPAGSPVVSHRDVSKG